MYNIDYNNYTNNNNTSSASKPRSAYTITSGSSSVFGHGVDPGSGVINLGPAKMSALANLAYWYLSQPRLGKTKLNGGDIRAFYEETSESISMQYFDGQAWCKIK